MKPRASASFCHWPKLTSTPSGQVGPSCVSSPDASRSTTSSAPARSTAATTAGSSSSRGTSPTPTRVARPELEAEEVLERARRAATATASAGIRARSTPSTRMRPPVGWYSRHSSFTSVRLAGAVLADDRDDRAGLQIAG